MTTTWNPERVIIKHVSEGGKIIKVHEGYLPLVLALVCRGLIRIIDHANGLIEIGPRLNDSPNN